MAVKRRKGDDVYSSEEEKLEIKNEVLYGQS